jgi:hypothetical protein
MRAYCVEVLRYHTCIDPEPAFETKYFMLSYLIACQSLEAWKSVETTCEDL